MELNERVKLRASNKRRLRALGLPCNLFDADFWEKEIAARKDELLLLAAFEEMARNGRWQNLSLPWQDIIDRWKKEIASPMHFASIGPNAEWTKSIRKYAEDLARRNDGRFAMAWKKRDQKTRIRNAEMVGKSPPKFRT